MAVTKGVGTVNYIPHQFGYLTERGIPIVSIIASFIIGCVAFLPFPAWSALVQFIISATVMGYAAVPLAFGAMSPIIRGHSGCRPAR
jgi:amino acid transporter